MLKGPLFALRMAGKALPLLPTFNKRRALGTVNPVPVNLLFAGWVSKKHPEAAGPRGAKDICYFRGD